MRIIVRAWKTEHGDVVSVYRNQDGSEYRWHVRAANGEIVGQGESHSELSVAVTAAKRHHPPVASEE